MRLFKFRMRRLERRMISFKRLSLIADKIKDGLDFGDGSLVRNEIVEIVEKFDQAHGAVLSEQSDVPLASSESPYPTGSNTYRFYMTYIV